MYTYFLGHLLAKSRPLITRHGVKEYSTNDWLPGWNNSRIRDMSLWQERTTRTTAQPKAWPTLGLTACLASPLQQSHWPLEGSPGETVSTTETSKWCKCCIIYQHTTGHNNCAILTEPKKAFFSIQSHPTSEWPNSQAVLRSILEISFFRQCTVQRRQAGWVLGHVSFENNLAIFLWLF